MLVAFAGSSVHGQDVCCEDEADTDYSGVIDIGDMADLITSLFIDLLPLAPCPWRLMVNRHLTIIAAYTSRSCLS
jgi:hypothetical protein